MSFTDLFYKHIMFREACGKCHFANTRRPSDITLGDFWGWERFDPDINKDDKGLSLIFINTEKGRKLFETVKGQLLFKSVKIEDCLQPNLQHPSVPHPSCKDFERDYREKGFEYVFQHDYDRNIKFYVVQWYRGCINTFNKLKRKCYKLFKILTLSN